MRATVTGFPALKKRLVDILPDKVRAAASEAMLRGGDRIVTQAKATVPRDSGDLAASIRHTGVNVDKSGRLVVGVVAGNESTTVTSRGGKFQVARLVEFGSRHVEAEPFFLPAWRSNRRGIQTGIRTAIKKAVKAAAS